MRSAKILGLVVSFFIVYSMPTEKKLSESWKGPLSNKKEESNAFYKGGAKSNTTKDDDGKSSTSTRYVRTPYLRSPSKPIETLKPYKFDYLIRSPNGDLQFREESGFPNGTVKGFYGHYESGVRYLVVNYTADANGYRATIQKDESGPGRIVVLTAERGPGGITYVRRAHVSRPSIPAVVNNQFQYKTNPNKTKDADEDNDEY